MRRAILFFVLIFAGGVATSAFADQSEYTIVIKDHQFSPEELTVPKNQKIKLIIENQDSTAEEFESYDLNREKIVDGNQKITVFIGPLNPGTYEYFGEFHQETAHGTIIVN